MKLKVFSVISAHIAYWSVAFLVLVGGLPLLVEAAGAGGILPIFYFWIVISLVPMGSLLLFQRNSPNKPWHGMSIPMHWMLDPKAYALLSLIFAIAAIAVGLTRMPMDAVVYMVAIPVLAVISYRNS